MPSDKSSRPSRTESVNCKWLLNDRNALPDSQIKLFCKILKFQDHLGRDYNHNNLREKYMHRIEPYLAELKHLVCKPGRIRQLVLPPQSEYTHLCDMHNRLNADFVHQWFKMISLEVGARLELLRASGREYLGEVLYDDIIYKTTCLHTMWLSSTKFDETFPGFRNSTSLPYSDAKQSDGCEACILARIGSNSSLLIKLRAIIKSRISPESHKRHPERLRLLRLVDGWLQVHRKSMDADAQSWHDSCMQASEIWADQLYIKRKELKIVAHKQYREKNPIFGKSKAIPTTDDIESSIADAENDIIEDYTALKYSQRASTMISNMSSNAIFEMVKGKGAQGEQVQTYPESVYTNASMVSDPFSTQASLPNPVYGSANPAYLESRYSVNTIANNERVLEGRAAALADLESDDFTPRFSVAPNPFGSEYGERSEHNQQRMSTEQQSTKSKHDRSERSQRAKSPIYEVDEGYLKREKSLPATPQTVRRHQAHQSTSTNATDGTIWPVAANGSKIAFNGTDAN